MRPLRLTASIVTLLSDFSLLSIIPLTGCSVTQGGASASVQQTPQKLIVDLEEKYDAIGLKTAITHLSNPI